MKELHQTAKAYYRNAADDVKAMAKKFLYSLDKDGEVSLAEFLPFMKREGYPQMANRDFFKELNMSGTGKLDFWEVMTLFYIIHSGRQFCDGCGKFMKGLYFACVRCFEHKDTTFSVCSNCFDRRTYRHHHKEFLDNYVLLETKRPAALKKMKERADMANEARRNREVTPGNAVSNAVVVPNPNRRQETRRNAGSGTQATSTAIVPYNRNHRNVRLMDKAVRAVADVALKAANVAALLNCTIM